MQALPHLLQQLFVFNCIDNENSVGMSFPVHIVLPHDYVRVTRFSEESKISPQYFTKEPAPILFFLNN